VTRHVVVLVAAGIAGLAIGTAGAAQPARGAATAPAYASIAEAARKQDWMAVQAMIQQKGDLNAASTEGSTALHFAVGAGQATVVQALLAAGADISKRNLAGVSPLHLAVLDGETAITKLLLAKGADARIKDEASETLLMLAARHGDGEMATALIGAGADLNYVEPNFGQDALMIAVRASRPSVVDALVKQHGIKPDRLGAEGVGPFAPVAGNDSETGRAKNRRVEMVLR